MLDVYQAAKKKWFYYLSEGNEEKNKYFPGDTWIISHVSFEHLIFVHFLLVRNFFFPSLRNEEKKVHNEIMENTIFFVVSFFLLSSLNICIK
jgi:hypothetical protein